MSALDTMTEARVRDLIAFAEHVARQGCRFRAFGKDGECREVYHGMPQKWCIVCRAKDVLTSDPHTNECFSGYGCMHHHPSVAAVKVGALNYLRGWRL